MFHSQTDLSPEQRRNLELVRRWNILIWEGDFDIFEHALTPNCIFHCLGGLDEVKTTIKRIRGVFPNIKVAIHRQFAFDDKVLTLWSCSGTHQNELWGILPTGRQVTYTGMTLNRLDAGKIVEEWSEANYLSVLKQINGHS